MVLDEPNENDHFNMTIRVVFSAGSLREAEIEGFGICESKSPKKL